jgi:putative ATPase
MKQQGYGDGYAYDHDAEDGFSGQNYFPDELDRQTFYQPTDRGEEQVLSDRLTRFVALRRTRQAQDG